MRQKNDSASILIASLSAHSAARSGLVASIRPLLTQQSLLADRSDLAVRHVIGERDWELFGDHEVSGPLQYTAVRYEKAMHDLYAAVDLLVCRAGATSVAEIAQTGTPAVFVPLPGAPGDHQTKNARALTEHGGGILVQDGELDGPSLAALIEELSTDPERLGVMSRNALAQAKPAAASAIADLVETHARER